MTGVVCYNTSLSIYYVSVIKFGMTENAFRQKIEKYLHVVTISFTMPSALYLLFADQYGPVKAFCWIKADKTLFYRRVFGVIPVALAFIIITVNMLIIISAVISQERKKKKWQNRSSMNNRTTNCLSSSVVSISSIECHPQKHHFDLKAARRASLSLHQNSMTKDQGQGGQHKKSSPRLHVSANNLFSYGNSTEIGSNVVPNSGVVGKSHSVHQHSLDVEIARRASKFGAEDHQSLNINIPEDLPLSGKKNLEDESSVVPNSGDLESGHRVVPKRRPTISFGNLSQNVESIPHRRYSMRSSGHGSRSRRSLNSSISNNTVVSTKMQNHRLATSQGFLYIASFFLSFIFAGIYR
jgi:preprotein translocase subunit YajC